MLITISIGGNLILKSKKVLIIIEMGRRERGVKELDVLSERGRVCGCGKRGLERERQRERQRQRETEREREGEGG